jgi:Ca2+-transporting ATPase
VAVQTVAIFGTTTAAYLLGREYHPAAAGTLAFATLSFSELLRAFTARSERFPILRIGLFRNRIMLVAVGFSVLVLLATLYVPGLRTIMDTTPLSLQEWLVILPLLAIPSIVAELTKWIQGWKKSPTAAS